LLEAELAQRLGRRRFLLRFGFTGFGCTSAWGPRSIEVSRPATKV